MDSVSRPGFRFDGQSFTVSLPAAKTPTGPPLLGLLKAYVRPRGFTTLFGGMIALTDCTIHHQDVRRPLGLPREIQVDRDVPFRDLPGRG